jgi:hypothetical protein
MSIFVGATLQAGPGFSVCQNKKSLAQGMLAANKYFTN